MKRNDSKRSNNHLVWSPAQNTWVTDARNSTNARSKPALRRNLLATAILLAFAPLAQAAPVGGQVVSGAGSISQSGSITSIQQSSQNLSLDWQSFNIASQETVNFLQPSASAIAVNRIFDTNGTQILGNLNANGQVYLINPNGILFGQGAQVNVGGLVASTLNIDDASLNGTTRTFSGTGTGSVVNQGTINAADGGYVALLGNTVSNRGVITAQLGTVALGAGSAATLTFNGNSLVHMQVDQSTLDNLAENNALIQADGGQVLMTAGAKDALLASVVNNTGVIEARTVANNNGTIILQGGMTAGTVNVGGTLDASAPNGGDGGFIETSAAHVKVADDAQVTTASSMGLTGSWLIDPFDFNIASSGGDITGSALVSLLGSNSVTIQTVAGTNTATNLYATTGTAGNINVNQALSWSSGNTLTLIAENNINIGSNITATNGGLTLSAVNSISATAAINVGTFILTSGNWLQSNATLPAFTATDFRINGGTFTRVLGGDGSSGNPYQLNDIYGVQGMNGDLLASYVLSNNINNASVTSGWNAGAGFKPVGQAPIDSITYLVTDFTKSFQGTFDGQGYTISGLYINLPLSTDPWGVGLFGVTASGSSISNVYLSNANITGFYAVGGLAGANYGTVSNSHTTAGTVTGDDSVGGLVGFNYGGTGTNGGIVTNSYATANVKGIYGNIGGLVGFNYGVVSNSYATGTVSGIGSVVGDNKRIGGLVGANYFFVQGGGIISNSYATGAVIGGAYSYDVGGLVGRNKFGTIESSHATGTVSGAGFNQFPGGQGVGGLVGYSYGNGPDGLISNSYATGNVTGTTSSGNIGGLVGYNVATISNSYAIGTVSGGANSGGLVGLNSSVVSSSTYGTINNSYATGTVGGNTDVGGLVGLNDSGSTISNSYAKGSVSGGANAGGLAGVNAGTVNNSYATGTVGGNTDVGGLVGLNDSGSTISNSYSIGSVSGSGTLGGLVGVNAGTVSNSFWDTTTSGKTTSAGGTGMTTADMQTQANFTTATLANGSVNPGWDLATTWIVYDTFTRPLLRSFMTPLTVTANNATKTYDGLAAATATGVTCNLGLCSGLSNLLGTFNWGGVTNAGTYLPSAKSGLYSNQQGYIISYVNGTLTINPKVVTLSGTKIYDGFATFTVGTVGTNLSVITGVSGQSLGLSGTASTANKNVGNTNLVNSGTLALSNGTGLATNYTLTGVGLTGVVAITPLALTDAAIADASSIYGATVIPGAVSFGNIFSGDVVTSTASIVSPVNSTSGHLNAGTYKQTATTLVGADAGNYSLVTYTTPTNTYTVSKLALTGASIAAASSTYASALTPGPVSFTNIQTGTGTDIVTSVASVDSLPADLSTSGHLKVGSYTQTAGTALSGTDAGNYSFAGVPSAANYTINPLAVSVTGLMVTTKPYDGTTIASFTGTPSIGGIIPGDTVNNSLGSISGSFADKNVGNIKAVNLTSGVTLSGADSGNYTLNGVSGLTGSITPRVLNVSGTSVSNKVYDGTATASLSGGSLTGVLSGEVVTLTQSGTFDLGPNVGNGKTVIATDSLGGGAAGNYSLVQPTDLTANITPAPLAITATSGSKTYDNNVLFIGGFGVTYSGFVASENAGVLGGALTYDSGASYHATNAGNYTITPGGLTSNNYAISYVNGTLTINPAVLTATIINNPSKVYNGTTVATLTSGNYSLSGFVGAQDATVGQTVGTYNSKDVATASSVSANLSSGNFTADPGTLLTNYSLPATATGPGSINQAALDVIANDIYKSFGDPDNLTYSTSALASGDTKTSVFSGSLTRVSGESVGGPYAVTQGTLAANSNYSISSFTDGSLLIVPLVEAWQPTTQFTQTSSTAPPTLPSQLAQLDRQQARPLTAYASNDGTSGQTSRQWGSGNGPAVTILDGGVRMPDAKDDERKDRQ